MRLTKAISLCFLVSCLIVLGGCGATSESPHQSVIKIKASNGKQEVTKFLARGNTIKGYSYQYTIDINGDKKVGKTWASGSKRRSETIVDAQKVITIYDSKDEIAYSYYPARHQAVKMPAEETPELVASPEDYLQGILNDQINILGETRYRSYNCKLILAKDPQSAAKIKLWVKTDWGMPIRVESTDPDGNSCLVEYTNINVSPQPASLFRLPAGIKVVDLVSLMNSTGP